MSDFLRRSTARPIPPPNRYVYGVPMDQLNRRERFFWRRAGWVRWLLIRLPPFRNVRPLSTKIVFDRINQPKENR